jgi:DNA invertase Pin-like site-specific DNA recombinase
MNMSKAIPAAVYYRKSTDKQEDSIDRQRSQVEPYALQQAYRLVGEYLDEGISGDEFDKRPGLLRLIKDAKAGKFKTIIVDEPSRLSRQEPIDFIAMVVKPLRDAGINVVSVSKGPQDWDSIVGFIMLAINQNKSVEECKDLSRRVMTQLLDMAKKGAWLGGPVPYGLETAACATAGKRYVAGDPVKARAVQLIFSLCGEGKSLRVIARELVRQGVPDPSGRVEGGWNITAIRNILTNRKYVGDRLWNQRHAGKYYEYRGGNVSKATPIVNEDGKPRTIRYNGHADWIIARDVHDALVSRELFEKCQRQLQENRERTTPIQGGGDFLLTSLLVCTHCGYRLVGRTLAGRRYYLPAAVTISADITGRLVAGVASAILSPRRRSSMPSWASSRTPS